MGYARMVGCNVVMSMRHQIIGQRNIFVQDILFEIENNSEDYFEMEKISVSN